MNQGQREMDKSVKIWRSILQSHGQIKGIVENRSYNVITHYYNRPICRYVFPLFQKYIDVTKM